MPCDYWLKYNVSKEGLFIQINCQDPEILTHFQPAADQAKDNSLSKLLHDEVGIMCVVSHHSGMGYDRASENTNTLPEQMI